MGNYLYNGVSLPPLVGWDGMPPAGIFILHDSRNGTYVLCGVSAAPQCVLVNGEDEPALPFDVFGTVFVALEGAESWGESQNFKPLEYFSATEGAYIRQRYVGWLWTQSDILTADGQNIYMAATAPIKVAEDSGITIDDVRRHYRRGYTAGVVFGRNSGGNLEGNSAADVAKASKNAAIPAAAYSVQPRDNTPGNYLYNGVELPPLPHWDDMPPFGVFIIYIASEQLYRLYGANDAPFCIKIAGAEKIAFSADIFGSYQKARAGETNWFGLKAFDGNLSDIADFEDGIYILRSENKIIWTKETIFNSDGQSVFLAATEPIKIELPEQLTEADLRRSWRRGMALGVVVGVKARKIIKIPEPPVSNVITTLFETLSTAVGMAGAAKVGNKIYLFGGHNGKAPVRTIQTFDPETETATTLSTRLPTALYEIAAAAVGTKVYLFGGIGDSISSAVTTIYAFDTASETISTLSATLPIKTWTMAAAAVGTKVYLFGGRKDYSSSGFYDTIYVFDTETETITTLPAKLPIAAGALATATVGNKIYLFGGFISGGFTYSGINVFDVDTETVTSLTTPLPTYLSNSTAAMIGTKIYLFGGVEGVDYYDGIIMFDPETGISTTLSVTLPDPTYGISAIEVNRKVYLLGGRVEKAYLNTINVFH